MFCIYLRTNSDLCHLQHKLIGFYNQMKSVYSAVRTGSLNKAVCGSSVKVKGDAVQQVVEFLANQRSMMSQKAWNTEFPLRKIKPRYLRPPTYNLVCLRLQLPNLDIEFSVKCNISHTKLQIHPQYAVSLLTWPSVQQLSVYTPVNAGFFMIEGHSDISTTGIMYNTLNWSN